MQIRISIIVFSSLLAGGLLGWFVNDQLNKRSTTPSSLVKNTDLVQSDDDAPEMVRHGQVNISNSIRLNDVSQSETEILTTPDSLDVRSLIDQLRFDEIITLCANADVFQACRQSVINALDASDLLPSDSERLMRFWMTEFPDDVEMGIKLVDSEIQDKRYHDALGRLLDLKSYQYESAKIEPIMRKAQVIAREGMVNLSVKNDDVGLRNLLLLLVAINPDRAAWRYALAKTEMALEMYKDASLTLTYILYEPDYGDRASKMYQDIIDRIDLAAYVEVPLRKKDNQYIVKARVNDIHEISLLLDTGASVTAIDSKFLDTIGYAGVGRDIILNTAGGQVNSRLLSLQSLAVGNQKLTQVQVASIDMIGLPTHGLLGVNYLSQFKFVIDEQKRKLFLSRK